MAQITTAQGSGGQKPFVVQAGNGVPVVNIVTPNASGVSHNIYSGFNVGAEGAILNNSHQIVDTQLGGKIPANPYIRYAARLILNEVTGQASSKLSGPLEVAGQAAEVIIANPYGITCNGCGFINIPNLTLATGVPQLSSLGTLTGYNIGQGAITVEGRGLNATNLEQVNLLARSIVVNAGLWTNQLNIMGGAGIVDVATGTVAAASGTGGPPAFWLDVGALGGMYANRIRLVGTEMGLGVNTQGTIAALTGDIQLASHGRISLGGKLVAAQNLRVASNGDIANSGSVFAKGDLTVNADGVIDNSGALVSTGHLAATAKRIEISGNLASGLDDSGMLVTPSNLTLTGKDEVIVSGKLLSGNQIAIAAKNATLDGSRIEARQEVRISARGGSISARNAAIAAESSLAVNADEIINLSGAQIGSPQIRVDGGSVGFQGTHLTASGDGGLSVKAGDSVDTSNALLETQAGPAEIQSGRLVNQGGQIIAQSGDIRISAPAGIDNRQGLIGGNTAVTLVSGDLDNTGGKILSGTRLSLQLDGGLLNRGQILAGGDLELHARGLSNGSGAISSGNASLVDIRDHLDNGKGTIESSQTLTVAAGSLDNGQGRLAALGTGKSSIAVTNATTNRNGLIGANGELNLSTASLSNAMGLVTAQEALTLSAGVALDNVSGLIAGKNLTIRAGTLDNAAGSLQAQSGGTIGAGTINNAGGFIAGGSGLLTVNSAGGIGNAGGTIGSDADVTLAAAAFDNRGGKVQAGNTTTLKLVDSLDNRGGLLQAGNTLNLTAPVFTSAGGTLSAPNADITTYDFATAGTRLIVSDALRLDIANTLDNTSGAIGASSIDIKATTVVNTDGRIESPGNLSIRAQNVDNSRGAIAATGVQAVDVLAQNVLDNQGGNIAGNGNVHIQTGTLLNRGGTIQALQNLTASVGGRIDNRADGAAAGQLLAGSKLDATAESVDNGGGRMAAGILFKTDITGALGNQSGLLEGQSLDVSAGSINNQGGRLFAWGSDTSQIRAQTLFDNTGGQTAGNGSLQIQAGGLSNAGGTIQTLQDLTIGSTGPVDNRTSGRLLAGGQLDLAAGSVDNGGGLISAGTKLKTSVAGILDNQGGRLEGNTLDVAAGSIANQGGRLFALAADTSQIRVQNLLDNTGGQIAGNGSLAIAAGSLVNTVQAGQGGLLQAQGQLQVTTGGNLTNSGGTLAAQALTISSGGLLDNRGGYAEGQSLQVQAGSLDNRGGELVAATLLKANVAGILGNQGGLLEANNLDVTADSLDNTGGKLNSLGTGRGAAAARLAVTNRLDNRDGRIAGNGDLTIAAGSIDNSAQTGPGGLIQAQGRLQISATGDLSNTGGALLAQSLAATAGATLDNRAGYAEGLSLQIQAGVLKNDGGQLLATGTGLAQIQVAGQASNALGGSISGNGAMLLQAGSLDNGGGTIQALQDLTVSSTGQLGNRATGRLLAGNQLALTAGGVDNGGGIMAAGTTLKTTVALAFGNQGGLLEAGDTLDVTAGSLDNTGGKLHSLGSGTTGARLTVANQLDNRGGWIAGNGDLTLATGNLVNAAQSGQGGSITAQSLLQIAAGGDLNNAGGILAAQTLSAAAGGLFDNRGGHAEGQGLFVSAGSLDNGGGSLLSTGTGLAQIHVAGLASNQGGGISANGNLQFQSGSIRNGGGTVQSQQDLALAAGQIDNRSGQFLAGGSLDLTALDVDNSGGIMSAGGMRITVGSLTNRLGAITQTGTQDFAVTVTQTLDNQTGHIAANGVNATLLAGSLDNAAGRIDHAGSGTLTLAPADGVLRNAAGVIATGGDLALNAAQIDNRGGTIQVGRALSSSTLASLDNRNGALSANADLALTISGAFDNQGGRLESARTLAIQAGSLDNSAGQILALGNTSALALQTTGDLVNTDGLLASNGDTLAAAGRDLVNGGGTIQAKNNATAAAARTLSNDLSTTAAGRIIAGQSAAVDAASLLNNGGTVSARALAMSASAIANRGGAILQSGSADFSLHVASLDNTLGTVAANADNFTLSADALVNEGGSIEHAGSGNLQVAQNGGTLRNAGGAIASAGLLDVAASQVDNVGGTLQGNGGLQFADGLQTLANRGGRVISGADLTLAAATALDNSAGLIQAGNTLSLSVPQLDNREGSILALGSGGAILQVAGTVDNRSGLVGGKGDLALSALSLDNSAGSLKSAGNLGLTLTQGLVNQQQGVLAAGRALTLVAGNVNNDGGSLSGDSIALASATLSNRGGTLLSTGSADFILQTAGGLDNSGGRIAANGANLRLQADSIANAGGRIEHAGSGTLSLVQSAATLDNSGGFAGTRGRILAHATQVTNLGGIFQAERGLDFGTALASVDNRQGKLISGGDLALALSQDFKNGNGTLEAGGTLTLSAVNVDNSAGRIAGTGAGGVAVTALGNLLNQGGTIGGNGAVQLGAAALDNRAGTIQAMGALTLDATTLANSGGTVLGNGAARITALTIDNSAGVLGGGALTLAASSVDNRGGRLASSGNASVNVAGTLDNTQDGRISMSGANSALSAGQLLNGGGTIVTAGSLASSASRIENSGGILSAAANLALNADTIDNAGGKLYGGTLNLSANQLNNSGGETGASYGATLNVGSIANSGGKIVNDRSGTLAITTSSLDNGGGHIQSAATLALTANGGFANSGELYAGNQLSVTVNGGSLTNRGQLVSGGSATLGAAGTIDNDNGGTIAANGSLTLQGSTITNRGGTIKNAGSGETRLSAGLIDNSGGTLAANGLLTLNAASVANRNGSLRGSQVGGNFTSLDNSNGTIWSASSLAIGQGSVVNDGGTLGSDNTVTIAPASFSNHGGKVQAAHFLDFRPGSLAGGDFGTLASNGDTTLSLSGGLVYQGYGLPLSTTAGLLTLKLSGDFQNNATLSKQNFRLEASNIGNAGTLSGDNLTLIAGGAFTNSGVVSATQNLTVNAQAALTNTGQMTGGSLNASSGGSLYNSGANALLGATGNATLSAGASLYNTGGADIYSGGSLALNASGLLNEYSRIQSAGNMTLTIASGGITNRADAPTVQDSQSGLYGLANYQFRDGNWGSNSLNQWFSFNWLFLTDEYGVNHYLYLPGPFTGAYEALGGFTLINPPAGAQGCDRAGSIAYQDFSRSASAGARSAVIAAGGNLSYSVSGNVWNEYGDILAGAALSGYAGGGVTNLGVDTYDKTRTTTTFWGCSDIQGGSPGMLGNCVSGWSPRLAVSDTLHSSGYVGGRFSGSLNLISARSITNASVAPGTTTALGSLASAAAAGGSAAGSGAVNAGDGGQFAASQNGSGTAIAAVGGNSANVAGSAPGALAGVAGAAPGDVTAQNAAAPVTAAGPAAGQANGTGSGSGPSDSGNLAVAAAGGANQPAASASSSGQAAGNGPGNSAVGSGNGPAAIAANGTAPGATSATLTVTDPVSGLTTRYQVSAPARLQDSAGRPARILVGDPLGGSFSLPVGGLFRVDASPGFLVQANGGLSSNAGSADSDDLYDLSGKTLKRLGDSLYEQRLVQEQILNLTGRTNLGNYADSQAQFAALVANGSAYAKAYGIAPGIALSAAQMEALTQDIVWLESREVDTPQGRQQALVPVVYVAALKGHDPLNQGGIFGNRVVLDAAGGFVNQGAVEGEQISATSGSFANSGSLAATSGVGVATTGGDLVSSGTIAGGSGPVLLSSARDVVIESARETVSVSLGDADRPLATFTGQQVLKLASVSGGDVQVSALGDLRIAGADVIADKALSLQGSSVTLGSVAQTASSVGRTTNGNAGGSRAASTRQLGSLILAGTDLTVRAANDLSVSGSLVGAQGDATLSAGGNLAVQAALDSASYQFTGRAHRHSADYAKRDESLVGSRISAGNNLTLGAGIGTDGKRIAGSSADLSVSASSLSTGVAGSGGGNLTLVAARDVTIAAGSEHDTLDSQVSNSRRGFLSSSSSSSSDFVNSTSAVGSSLSSGARLDILAGRDVALVGSAAVAQGDVVVAAAGKLSLEAAASTRDEAHSRQESKSGLFSGGGLSITFGNRSQKETGDSTSVFHTGSTLGSLGGDVSLVSGEGYRQMGSSVLAPLGSVSITAPTVEIGAMLDTSASRQSFEAKQSGLTLSVTSPVVDAARSLHSLAQAAGQTSDPRMLALAAAAGALTAKNTYDAIKGADGAIDPTKAAALNIGLSLGSSRSQSNSASSSQSVVGSSITAGTDLTIRATAGDLSVVGSSLSAGNNASLAATGNLDLLGAASTSNSQSSSSGSAASVGVGINTVSGLYVSAGASRSKGSGNGNDTLWTTTHVGAGNVLDLASGGDMTLKGATASGKQVVADVGGNLAIESLQDASAFREHGSSFGFDVKVPVFGTGFSASVNGGLTKIDSNYLSVVEQSGIRAGDGGFQVSVAGNTDLKGGAITSTQTAIDQGRNRFSTGGILTTSDIQNQASYDAQSVGVNIGTSANLDGKLVLNGTSAGFGNDSGNADSTTKAGISGIAGNKDARTGDIETGISKIFDADKVRKDINAQVQITQLFGQQASKSVGDYVQDQRNALQESAKNATAEEKNGIQAQLNDLATQERVMNVLIGAVTGQGGTALTKESLSAAADQMRQLMIEDSMKFTGVTDGTTTLSNISGESKGVRNDGVKIGGTRVDLDLLCGVANERCKIEKNVDGTPILDANGKTQLALNDKGQVQFNPEGAGGKSLTEFLETETGKKLSGPTGGVQGAKGTLFGIPYSAGSWQDKLIEAFSGTHDMVGGKLSGLYDGQGNIKREMTDTERKAYDTWAAVAIVPSAPFAAAGLLPPDVWKAISILLGAVK